MGESKQTKGQKKMIATMDQVIRVVSEISGYKIDVKEMEQVILDCWAVLQIPAIDEFRKEIMKKNE